jgi:hypothetical protein
MIVYKQWKETRFGGITVAECEGWFLLGVIPLYIRKVKL